MVPPSPSFSIVPLPRASSARFSSRSSISSNISRASTLSRASTQSDASFSSSFSHLSQASNSSACSSSITSFVDFTDPFEFTIPEDDEDDEKSDYGRSLPPTPTSPTTEVGTKSITEALEDNVDSPFLDTHSPHLFLLVPWIRISITSAGHASIFLLTASDPETLDSQSVRLSLASSSLTSTVPKVMYEEKRLKGSGPPSWEKKRVFDLQAEPGRTVSDIVNVVRAIRGVQWDGEYVDQSDRSESGRPRCKAWIADVLVGLQGRKMLHQRSVVCARTVGCTLANDRGSQSVCC